LADCDAVDFLFVDLGYDLHRGGRADPEQHIGWACDLADLSVASQHHAVKRSPQHQLVDPHLLRRDPRLGFFQPGPALLIFGLGGVALGSVFFGPIEVALQLLVVVLEFLQRAALLGVVLAAENLARLHVLPLATAQLE
jgi:hypothetical protein